jgi:DNA-binding SARP family transcriptional activator
VDEMRAALDAETDPERAARLEPELLAIAKAGAGGAAAGGTATPAAEPAAARISLLGGFAVQRGARDVTPASGRPSTLVKVLALRGTLTVDEALDLLWPTDEGEGADRARIRNLLHRVRSTSGDLIERAGDEALRLASDVVVDARRFEEAAALAMSAPRGERAALARRALAWATGELLPGDRYEDWADIPRERVRRRHLALLDLVADDAMQHGDYDEAARVLDEAIAVDPLEELRYVRLARALLAQGRSRAALSVAQRGLTAANELGVSPSADLRELLSKIAAIEGRGG